VPVSGPEPRLPTGRELRAIVGLVREKSGIALHEGKAALITARLQKRLRATGCRTFSHYLERLATDDTGDELVCLLDAITTNHTSFFREPEHFDILASQVVPAWLARGSRSGLEAWSAACATGEEPYSMAMALWDALPDAERTRLHVIASDLSTRAVTAARQGIYRLDRVADLPVAVQRRHFERGHGPHEGRARVRAHIRHLVDFAQVNLVSVTDLGLRFPVIFCRNVLIYFDQPVQQRVVTMLERHLEPGGFLFIAHSESLNGIEHGLQWVAPAVYRKVTP
jgi:chemotaxis protein methyltransferase CheR